MNNFATLKNLPYLNKTTLEVALEKRGENLNYWAKTLLDKGELIALKKGLYVSNLYLLGLEKNPHLYEVYLEYVANILRYPSYISLEYAMAKYGMIPEAVFSVTSVTVKSSRTYKNKLGNFVYRSIKENLFFGFTYTDFEDKKVKIASRAKALFDFLYFKKFLGQRRLQDDIVKGLRINWDVLVKEDKKEFEETVLLSGSFKLGMILKILKKEGIFQ